MDFTEKQKNKIAYAILKLDKLQPDYNESYKKHNSAKFYAGLTILGVLATYLHMFTGGYDEIVSNIGSYGVGMLPFILIGAIWYIYDCRKKYENNQNDESEAEKPLRNLGLTYWPPNKYGDSLQQFGRLWVTETGEDLNVEEFL